MLCDFSIQLVRMAAGKQADPGVHTGKLNDEKIVAIKDVWVRHIGKKCPELPMEVQYVFTTIVNGSAGEGLDNEVIISDSLNAH